MNETDAPIPPPPGIEPYNTSIESWTSGPDDWPNTVTVSVVTGWPAVSSDIENAEEGNENYADLPDACQLVQIDTNYKDTRPGQHPVRLTRTTALEFAEHILAAIEDTFHYTRVGRLRAAQAAELLQALDRVAYSLQDMREHALQDLLRDTGIEE